MYICRLYLAGIPLQIPNLYKKDITEIYKPECCPKNTPSLAPIVRWNHTETWRTGVDEFKDNSNSECTYMIDITSESFHDLNGHRIYKTGDDAIGEGSITVPITTYLVKLKQKEIFLCSSMVFSLAPCLRYIK